MLYSMYLDDVDATDYFASHNHKMTFSKEDAQNDVHEASTKANAFKNGVKMVEFFSGIGGMRYGVEQALQQSTTSDGMKCDQQNGGCRLVSCNAYEISLYANETYAKNFCDAHVPSSKSNGKEMNPDSNFTVRTKLVEQLKPRDLDGIADLWTMSPPCQPFTSTRNAKQRDSDDKRCNGLKAIMELLRTIIDKPRWIILENVKGFVGSSMLALWQECLLECGYSFEEYLLSPTQLGIPNHRTRFFMICERSDRFSCDRIIEDTALSQLPGSSTSANNDDDGVSEIEMHPVSKYLIPEKDSEYDLKSLIIPDDVFEKDWSRDLPLVSPMDRATHCFTAAYGRQIHRATGSLLLMDPSRTISVAELPVDRSNIVKYKGKIRRFSPVELLQIFGFPDGFQFPEDLDLSHQFKLVGNSVNVAVVCCVASFLLKPNINS